VPHPHTTSSRHIAPRPAKSGLFVTLATADDDVVIAVPDGAVAVRLAFYDDQGALVSGRVGFSVDAAPVPVTTGDDTLGYQAPEAETYYLSAWCQHLHLAAGTAGVTVRGTWYYD